MVDEKKFYDAIDITKDRPNGFTKFAKWFLFAIAILLGIMVIVAVLLMVF